MTSTAHNAKRIQARSSGPAQARRSARAIAQGAVTAHGRKAAKVTATNSSAVSGTSSSGKTRWRARLSTWLSTTVYQRKPGFAASAAAYHGTAIAAKSAQPHHGDQWL